MKNILKKLHIMSNQSEDAEGSTSSRGHKSIDGSSPDSLLNSRSHHNSEHKPLSGLSGWLNSVANRHSTTMSSSSNVTRGERIGTPDEASSTGLDVASDAMRRDSGSSTSRDPDVEEEYQIQLALEMSAREDPEAVQIEAVKQISLGSCASDNTPAEVVAYRYWNYNALSYDDKILDGFYDLYGILMDSNSERMPSLVDLQGTSVSEGVTWEAVLVNKAADSNLLKLEQMALEMAVRSRSDSLVFVNSNLVRKLAVLVADYMGGPVGDPDNMLRAWRNLSYNLKGTLGSMVLPLGSLTIGLARHRALLFKVLADSVSIPCRLVKGQQYTGSSDVAMNFVKIDDGREYIIDLMAAPGTLIPSDAAGSHIDYDESFFSASPLSRDIDSSHAASSSSGIGSSFEEHSDFGTFEKRSRLRNPVSAGRESDDRDELTAHENAARPSEAAEESKICSDDFRKPSPVEKVPLREFPGRPNYPYVHARSPSWTEGMSSPAVRKKKVKDVSQYMIDAAKENPQLAQKLHDVLLESGVVAPPNLFTEVYSEHVDASTVEEKSQRDDKDEYTEGVGTPEIKRQGDIGPARFLPPFPQHKVHSKVGALGQQEHLKPVEGLGVNFPLDNREIAGLSHSEVAPARYGNNVPVAAAAAAAAAVVASSMVVAAAKSSGDSNLELPVAAAATATAAAVVATTAAVSKQHEQGARSDGDTDGASCEPHGSGDRDHDALGSVLEAERISDRSTGSTKSDVAIDDVADCEIPWEDITLGERIGLGSYGEVYRGDWHGTEVAVKRFLDQDISGESLEEFRSEVWIMKRVRHPNVVLFMGAVTRAPNLSIVTEFLPRGSLYRLLHRPNNQLDERRRLRMALDAARGMNYLHNCTPVIVHRDLKSPNLLVDRNWVVKVCDFGLSRMKHSTFLSSRSTAGTAEWMAPEVLRNEPSDEKCDVYSFGVILWELSTMQQPWGGMNPMQVVGAVGFQHRRLDIPDDMDPKVADIIRKCWETNPKLRPTFSEIMAALKPLQKPINSPQVPRPTASIGGGRERVQPPRVAEEPTN
ncbi:probable serine/threonine-protein kinase SIS8 isoform X1 [Ziziphus jujuba]|uniref:Probable serine/threonine-protein kinase SIS8 isoform X1 n=1 Tax=Ziziphus jujuba TaxID=326968 RepID=A0ABM3IIU9_ZIZJJ|nr:probable serine/threonine-protein kinase SIS8 isoform X1 [Ziziphus jujuba]XP_048329350.2 probable serine/threonine-protein kinase SIS8 isoform X1 [Ziziphus jujuba]XP_048329351.2 probable serine/threonine-protein kinase SIS8 isoform X1 [Ziziphus jujuba]